MRYQNPSIPDAVRKLAQQGVDDLLLIPFSALRDVELRDRSDTRQGSGRAIGAKDANRGAAPYFEQADYINSLVANAESFLRDGFDHLLFSFHGVPERQIHKSDPTGCHCLTKRKLLR